MCAPVNSCKVRDGASGVWCRRGLRSLCASQISAMVTVLLAGWTVEKLVVVLAAVSVVPVVVSSTERMTQYDSFQCNIEQHHVHYGKVAEYYWKNYNIGLQGLKTSNLCLISAIACGVSLICTACVPNACATATYRASSSMKSASSGWTPRRSSAMRKISGCGL